MINYLSPFLLIVLTISSRYILGGFHITYKKEHDRIFCQKLGLTFKENDETLVELLLKAFYGSSADFNRSFRDMSETPIKDWSKAKCDCWGLKKLSSTKRFQDFLEVYQNRLAEEDLNDVDRYDFH